MISRWESVTNPLDKLSPRTYRDARGVGNQLPILLISFAQYAPAMPTGWESVTNPLDKLFTGCGGASDELGISYQSS